MTENRADGYTEMLDDGDSDSDDEDVGDDSSHSDGEMDTRCATASSSELRDVLLAGAAEARYVQVMISCSLNLTLSLGLVIPSIADGSSMVDISE